MKLPKYPVYVPSKGRADTCLTARFLVRDRVPFYLVVEPAELEAYQVEFGDSEFAKILTLPRNGCGLIFARNWIKKHSVEAGDERHWQIDDNIRQVRRWYRGKRLPCRSGPALRITEDFVDRYENVAIAGLNYTMFGVGSSKPFVLNCHVYSCSLVLNSIEQRWRLRYNDDTDLCLQVLAAGYCTMLFNLFLVDKARTMVVKGGNTDDLYQGDGRLEMARSLERMWPGVVETRRRFQRPQHVIKAAWRKFDNPLIKKQGLEIPEGPDEHGLRLKARREVKSAEIRALLEDE